MKALVLSGGTGARMRPLSYSMPKQLIPIANKPVLEHVIESIRGLGVREVGIIVGDHAEMIVEVIGDGSRLGVEVTYIPQDKPRGLAHCVALAFPFLGDDDFVMYLGDNLLPDSVREIAEEFCTVRPAAQVVVHKVSDPRAFGVAELDEDGKVLRLVEKPQQPKSDLALVGVYFFTPAVHQAVASICPSARGELEITDAIQWLLTEGHRVDAREYQGYWRDTGCAEDILDCNRHLLRSLVPGIFGQVDDASKVDPQVRIEAGATVIASRIDGPAIIGTGTVIEGGHIGPNTSVGRGCTLRDSRIRNSIILDGATISRIPGIHSSLIGRNANVDAVDRSHASYRLVVGDDTWIELGV